MNRKYFSPTIDEQLIHITMTNEDVAQYIKKGSREDHLRIYIDRTNRIYQTATDYAAELDSLEERVGAQSTLTSQLSKLALTAKYIISSGDIGALKYLHNNTPDTSTTHLDNTIQINHRYTSRARRHLATKAARSFAKGTGLRPNLWQRIKQQFTPPKLEYSGKHL